MKKGVVDSNKGKRYRKSMIIFTCIGIALSVAGFFVLCYRRTFPGILCFCLSFAALCAAGVFERKAKKYPIDAESETSSPELSEEQLAAVRKGKPAYNFNTSFLRRRINIMGAAFIGVGLLFVATGLIMFWIERGHDTSKMMIGIFSAVIMMGTTCVLAGILLLSLKKHPQRAPYLKGIILVFCIAAGVFLFVITDFSGSVIYTDILQIVVVFFAMDAVIRQGRL